MPTEAVNPCEAVLMPMSGIRVVLSRLISAGVMANDETMTVRVAAHRQFVEELLARARVADRLDDQIVAGRSQHFVEAFDDARGEPVELAAAHQQRHAVGAARFEDASHAG